MIQLTPRHSVDTMARLSNENMAYMHIARPTAMQAALQDCIRSVFATDICLDIACLLTNLHRRLQKYGSFNENRRCFGQPRELRNAVE